MFETHFTNKLYIPATIPSADSRIPPPHPLISLFVGIMTIHARSSIYQRFYCTTNPVWPGETPLLIQVYMAVCFDNREQHITLPISPYMYTQNS